MPVRATVVQRMVEAFHGGPWVWNGATGECLSPEWSREQNDAAVEQMDALYVAAVTRVDWNRILLIAQGVCIDRGCEHDFNFDDDGGPPHVCPDSIREALLQTER